MADRRNRSLGTKVTQAQYEAFAAAAGARPLSEWVRDACVAYAAPARSDLALALTEELTTRALILETLKTIVEEKRVRVAIGQVDARKAEIRARVEQLLAGDAA